MVNNFTGFFFLQLLSQTVCMNKAPTVTWSISVTPITTVDHVPASTGQFAVSESAARSLTVLIPSNKTAVGAAKVQVVMSLIKDQSTTDI